MIAHAHVHDARGPSRDPTGTRPVRRALETSATRRWRLLELAARDVIVDRDAFGFRPGSPTVLDGDGKLRAFEAWFDSSIRAIVVGDGTWFASHVVRGYGMGQRRGEKIAGSPAAASVSSLRVVIEAARADFQGIAAAVTQQVVRAASAVIMAKLPPSQLYRSVLEVVRKVGVVRTRLFSSYVVVRAHAAGTLDALESAGVSSVGLEVEGVPVIRVGDLRPMGPGRAKKRLRTRTRRPVRSGKRRAAIERAEAKLEKLKRVHVQTAGDDKVCPICEAIEEEGPYTIDQARSLIPAHPNCRCAFVPATRKKVRDHTPGGHEHNQETHGNWSKDPDRPRASGKSAVAVQAAVDAVPEEHVRRARLSAVRVRSVDKIVQRSGHQPAGVFRQNVDGTTEILVADTVKGMRVKDVTGVAMHELGHALDYSTGMSSRIGSVLRSDFDRMRPEEKYLARYWGQSEKELFAEAYKLAYSPAKKGAFGMGQKRAEKVFSRSLEELRKPLV